MNNIFLELAGVLVIAGAITVLISRFKQPPVIAYILTGLVVGPFGYYHLQQKDIWTALGEVGITLLLFMVGLELDVAELKRLGKTAVVAGIGQIVLTSAAGFAIARWLGYDALPAIYIALALTFASTIIIVKLLSDKRDLQSLYGKITIGIFLMQDFAAIFILIFLSSLSGGHHDPLFPGIPAWQTILLTLEKVLLLGLIIVFNSRYVFPKIMRFLGKSDELLLVFSLAWAMGLAAFVSLPFIGFSLEIGGFLAGLALANSAVHYEIGARIKSLRDFFIIIFFIVLGSQLQLTNIIPQIGPALILSAFVLIGNPLIVMILLSGLGYKPRTSFLAGITVGQISEFSLILITLGLKLHHVNADIVALVTLVGLITISLSSYSIMYADRLYLFLQPLLNLLDFRKGAAEKGFKDKKFRDHIVVLGGHRLGDHIIQSLLRKKQKFILVDHNPDIIEKYLPQKVYGICGDITDPHIQELVNLDHAKLVISTIPNLHDNLSLVEVIKNKNPHCRLIFTAEDEAEAVALYEKKIDYALLPHFIGGIHIAKILEGDDKFGVLRKLRTAHIKLLARRD